MGRLILRRRRQARDRYGGGGTRLRWAMTRRHERIGNEREVSPKTQSSMRPGTPEDLEDTL
eukprot:1740773-Pyramimonas_sp.AAC.1